MSSKQDIVQDPITYALYSSKAVAEGRTSVAIYQSLDRPGEQVSVTNAFSTKELMLKHKTADEVYVGRVGRWIRNEKTDTAILELKHQHNWDPQYKPNMMKAMMGSWEYERKNRPVVFTNQGPGLTDMMARIDTKDGSTQ